MALPFPLSHPAAKSAQVLSRRWVWLGLVVLVGVLCAAAGAEASAKARRTPSKGSAAAQEHPKAGKAGGAAQHTSKGNKVEASATRDSATKASATKASATKASATKDSATKASATNHKDAKPSKGKGGSRAGGKGADGSTGADDSDEPSAKERKRLARERAALRQKCKKKAAVATKVCQAFVEEEKARAEELAQDRALDRCQSKKTRKSKDCKEVLAKGGRVESDACGRKYGRARKRDTVAKFAARYGVSEATVRRYNDLADSVKKLKAGKRLLIGKSPHDGVVLTGGVQLGETPHLRLRRTSLAWGKPLLVDMLREAAATVHAQSPLGPRLMVGDLSQHGGGCLPPHKSHRGGLDADVGYYFRGGREPNTLADAGPATIDADRSWQLLKALLLTGRVQYAFVHYSLQPALYEAALRAGETPESLHKWLQYPRGIDNIHVAPIRHLKGHDDHFHLRLRCDGEGCGLSEAALAQLKAARIETLGGPVAEGRRRHGPPSAATIQTMR